MYRWSRISTRALPLIRVPDIPPIVDDLGLPSPIVPLVDAVPALGGASSSALVPVPPPAARVRGEGSLQAIVDDLAFKGIFAGQGVLRFSQTSYDFMDLQQLAAAGTVAIENDEFHESQICLRTEGIAWSPVHLVSAPVSICRVSHASKNPLKLSKLEVLVALVHQGWTDGRPAEPLTPDSAQICKLNAKQSLSYLCVMMCKDKVFAKGAPSIDHDQCDHYYRVLLRLDANALAQALAMFAGKKDDWFRRLFKKHKPKDDKDSDSSDDPVVQPRPNRVPPEAGLASPLPAPIIDPSLVPWRRQLVSIGGDSEKLKVYVDNMCHVTGVQKTWLTCLEHDRACIRWRNVVGEKPKFFARMYAWHLDGRRMACLTDRETHMAHDPSEDFVLECERCLVLEDF